MKTNWLVAAVLLWAVSVPRAWSDAPRLLPVQGVLTDAGGIPLDQTVSIRFALYDVEVAGTELWTESQAIEVRSGFFSAYLGRVAALDLALFKSHGDLWLGVSIGADPEMSRIRLGSSPYAGFAAYSSYTSGLGIQISVDNVIASTLGDAIESSEITNATIRREDLAQDGCQDGQVLQWNGTGWACGSGGTGTLVCINRECSALGTNVSCTVSCITGVLTSCGGWSEDPHYMRELSFQGGSCKCHFQNNSDATIHCQARCCTF